MNKMIAFFAFAAACGGSSKTVPIDGTYVGSSSFTLATNGNVLATLDIANTTAIGTTASDGSFTLAVSGASSPDAAAEGTTLSPFTITNIKISGESLLDTNAMHEVDVTMAGDTYKLAVASSSGTIASKELDYALVGASTEIDSGGNTVSTSDFTGTIAGKSSK